MSSPPLSVATPAAPRRRTSYVMQPGRGFAPLDLQALWDYRDLIYFLTWRDVKVRYKNAALGFAWVIVQPVINMIIFTVIFGRLAGLPSGNIPYPVFTFAALLPWTYFSYVATAAGMGLVANAQMLSKIYFPRLSIPVSAALGGLVDLCMSGLVLAAMMIGFHVGISPRIVFLPIFMLLAIAAALAVGIWMAALNVHYRDIKYVLPVMLQAWLFASPVAYSASVVKGKLAFVYALNPMAGVIQGVRWSLLGVSPAPGLSDLPSVVITLVLLISGLYYFRRLEQTFADYL
jgi:lipopolysaccharide transport system permease protein